MTKGVLVPWPTTILLAAASFLGFMGLSVMIELGSWLLTPAFILVVTTIAVIVARLLSRQRTLPTLVGAVVALVAMVPVFAVSAEGNRHLLPTPGALSDLGRAVRDGVDYAATSVAPASATPSFTALLTLGLIVLFLATDYLAMVWRAGATAGMVLLIPWLPAVIFQHRVSPTALIVSIALWLGVLALTRHRATAERTPAYGGAFVVTVATIGVVLLVTPLAVGGLGWGAFPRIDPAGGFNTTTRLNLAVDLRASLTTRSQSPVLVYDTTGSRPAALKLYALTDFDGVQWEREETTLPTTPAAGDVLWPTAIEDWTDRERTRLEMQVLDLQETNLPLPPTPRMVDIDGPWYYDAELDEVVGNDVTARDARYSVEIDTSLPVQDDLVTTSTGPQPSEAGMDPRYLALAPAIDVERVAALAHELTVEETTRHGQAVALQSYLRSTSEFTYDTSVSPRGSDAISTFLDDREGYCIHFATTMVMMARTLDIPARMAHGFLPGSPTDSDSYVVQGGDAHVWPELWFPEQGWVRYEPTPAVQTGTPPAYADPLVTQPGEGTNVTPEFPDFVPDDAQRLDTERDTGQGMPGRDQSATPAVPAWAWIAVGLAIVAAVGVWLWRKRSTARREHEYGPEVEWESLRTRLPEHMRWGTDLTPHEAAEFVSTQLRSGRDLPDVKRAADEVASGPATDTEPARDSTEVAAQAVAAIHALADAVADHRYAPAELTTPSEQLQEWANHVLAGAKSLEKVNV